MSRGNAPEQHKGALAVELWCIELASDPSGVDWDLLSVDERARAARFVFDRDRDRFVAAHAALRRVLAVYVGCLPAELRFVRDPQGRPSMCGGIALDFNLSHSGHLALIGVAASGPIGVDIEALRPVVDGAALAQRHFSPAEIAAWTALPSSQQDRAFLACWTRKEACLKALGMGLSVATNDFEVGVGASPRHLALRSNQESVEMTVAGVDVHIDAVAALATVGPSQVRTIARGCTELRRGVALIRM